MNIQDFKETDEEKTKRLKKIKHLFDIRITIAKEGREAFLKKEYVLAASKYHQYLGIYADYNEVENIFKITTSMFDSQKQMREMFLISQVYWDLVRINHLTPKLSENYQKALNQFVAFTINQPYQVLNAETLRKYINKSKIKNPSGIEAMQEAHRQIYVQSKKCYIATYLLTEEHPVVTKLRTFKKHLGEFKLGISFIRLYYQVSPKIILHSQKNKITGLFLARVVKPILYFLSFFIKGEK